MGFAIPLDLRRSCMPGQDRNALLRRHDRWLSRGHGSEGSRRAASDIGFLHLQKGPETEENGDADTQGEPHQELRIFGSQRSDVRSCLLVSEEFRIDGLFFDPLFAPKELTTLQGGGIRGEIGIGRVAHGKWHIGTLSLHVELEPLQVG